MKRDIMEIRSNINPMIDWLTQKEIEREEREKAEREAKWERERKEREEKEAKWKSEHPILDKYTYMSQWNWETYSYQGEAVNYYFYEWSNIYGEPRKFDFSIPFYKFLDFCKMDFSDDDNNKLKSNKTCYIVCKPGCNSLIIEPSYEALKEAFEKCKTVGRVLATVPEI
jgi:hypothetical protein